MNEKLVIQYGGKGHFPGKEILIFLLAYKTIVRMISYTINGLPALTGIVRELERDYGGLPDFDLTNRRNRQTVGRMIKWVMEKYGYSVVKGQYTARNRLRDFAGARLFTVSAIYEQNDAIAQHALDITSREIQH